MFFSLNRNLQSISVTFPENMMTHKSYFCFFFFLYKASLVRLSHVSSNDLLSLLSLILGGEREAYDSSLSSHADDAAPKQ